MASILLAPGADVTTCPTCGGPMGPPKRGSRASTRQWWFYTCQDLAHCFTQTRTTDPPWFYTEQPAVPLPASLSFCEPSAEDLAQEERECRG